MSVTSDYARIRGAFHRVARARRLTVADVELLVAVYELDQAGEQVTYACLYEAWACDPTRVRRSVGCTRAGTRLVLVSMVVTGGRACARSCRCPTRGGWWRVRRLT
jgi:hypothetical protein